MQIRKTGGWRPFLIDPHEKVSFNKARSSHEWLWRMALRAAD